MNVSPLPSLAWGARVPYAASPLEQHAEACGGSRVTALRGTAIGGFGAGQVAPLFEQDPELEGGLRVPAGVRAGVRAACTGQIAFLFEQ